MIALSIVTIGAKASVETQRLFERGEYTRYLYLHGLSVETAEALAEFLHRRIRQQLNIAHEDSTAHRRSVPPEVSRLALQLWLSGVPAHGRSDEAVCAAAASGEHRRAADLDLPAGARAEHFGDCGASSEREVLCGVESSKASVRAGGSMSAGDGGQYICYTRNAGGSPICAAERWQSG